MLDVSADIDRWLDDGNEPIALAMVVETWGSAPRKVGAKMAITAGGLISGSVSGGCVEGAVIEVSQEVLRTTVPQLITFGVADETAWDVGLACGGRIAVYVEPLDIEAYRFARDLGATDTTGVVATVIDGPRELLGKKLLWGKAEAVRNDLPPAITLELKPQLAGLHASSRLSSVNGPVVFADVLRPPPALIIIGGAHIAVTLARLAKTVGYRTLVIDPRRAFGSATRFPDVDRLIQAWPTTALTDAILTADTAVVTLSHDPKIDEPALALALGSNVFYIGALGSRRTHAARCERLLAQGMSDAQVARIRAPIGMDIGADNPEEIALAILAEMVAAYRQRLGDRKP